MGSRRMKLGKVEVDYAEAEKHIWVSKKQRDF